MTAKSDLNPLEAPSNFAVKPASAGRVKTIEPDVVSAFIEAGAAANESSALPLVISASTTSALFAMHENLPEAQEKSIEFMLSAETLILPEDSSASSTEQIPETLSARCPKLRRAIRCRNHR